MIYGNLTRDPELKSLPSGSAVANFSVATNQTYTDKEGKKVENVEYHNVVVFGRQAETVSQYLKKGSGVFIEGRLQTRSWEKDGQKQYRTEVVADRIQFGPRSGEKRDTSDSEGSQGTSSDTPDYPAEEIDPNDIPF